MIGITRAEEFDPNTVTPGVIGFVITFLVAAAVVLLVLDMTRRVRRVRYRTEITERLDAEEAESSDPESDASRGRGTDDDRGSRPLRDDFSPPER